MINPFRTREKSAAKPSAELPATPPAKAQGMELLGLALAQRAAMHLVFDNEVTGIRNLSCALTRFDANAIELELASLKGAGQRWLGEAVTCYFKIVENKTKAREIFHAFRSSVLGAGPGGRESVLITIKTPESIGRDQRRKSLRMTPDMADFAAVAVWPYDGSGSFDPCSPRLILSDFKDANVRLVNISAGGMQLAVKNAVLRRFDPGFKKGNRLIMFLQVTGDVSAIADECWLIAKAGSVCEDFVTKDVSVGLEFIGQGRVDPLTRKVAWKKVLDNVLEGVATWTHHWHLEMYRENGQ
ncbi:MAG: hypothetical protein HQK82_02780 [Desulfovibrionaceae bacterium]|nr:hypothetical protein [Desulfovibrionaceae bacterium]